MPYKNCEEILFRYQSIFFFFLLPFFLFSIDKGYSGGSYGGGGGYGGEYGGGDQGYSGGGGGGYEAGY